MRGGMLARASTKGASELPSVLLENRPFIKGTILLLLGRQAALTAMAMPPTPRSPRLLVVALRRPASLPVPGPQSQIDAEVAAMSRAGPWVLLLLLLSDPWGLFGVLIPLAGMSG